MRLLITGATGGFAGTALKRLLTKLPAKDLILMSRKPEKLAAYAKLGCEVRYGDYEEPDSIEAAAQGADNMLMISGHKVGYRIAQHSNAIDGAVRAGVKRIVYTSYYGSTADNTALVCQDHYGTEQKLAASGIAWTALRDGMYAQTMADACMPSMVKTGLWVTCTQGGKVSFVDRDDCVDCAVAALLNPGHENHVYNITGTDLWSWRDVADLATEITGKQIEVRDVSDEDFNAFYRAMGIPQDSTSEFNVDGFAWSCDDMISFEREVRKGKFAIVSDDIKLLTGHEPKSFRSFIMDRADELRAAAAA